MRFKDLKGLTGLPVESIKRRFRNEQVLTVLPVSDVGAKRDSLLIATPSRLALVTGEARPRSDHCMTQLVPWDVVRLADEEAAPEDDGVHRLVIHVGSLSFHAALPGADGQKALRDFVVIAQAQQGALAGST
jgi:hypothetical protein